MTENEKLRALLAEARRELGCVEALTVHPSVHNGPGGDALLQFLDRIDAALAEPVEPSESEYAMHARIRADYDKTVADSWRAHSAKLESERDEARAEVETLRAAIDGEPWGGAVLKQQRDEAIKKLGVTLEELWALEKQRDEARAKLALLERHYSPEAAAKLRAELAKANAEIASLRWGNEMACENTPTKDCECPGCCTARERAERGEV